MTQSFRLWEKGWRVEREWTKYKFLFQVAISVTNVKSRNWFCICVILPLLSPLREKTNLFLLLPSLRTAKTFVIHKEVFSPPVGNSHHPTVVPPTPFVFQTLPVSNGSWVGRQSDIGEVRVKVTRRRTWDKSLLHSIRKDQSHHSRRSRTTTDRSCTLQSSVVSRRSKGLQ